MVFGSAAKSLISFANLSKQSEQNSFLLNEDKNASTLEDNTHVSSNKETVSYNETGEEDEVTLHSAKVKLFELENLKDWIELGTGVIKINSSRDEPNYSRVCISIL